METIEFNRIEKNVKLDKAGHMSMAKQALIEYKQSDLNTSGFDGVQVFLTIDRLRQLGSFVVAKKGREFGTAETRAFLLLYGQELIDRLDETVRKFLEEKL